MGGRRRCRNCGRIRLFVRRDEVLCAKCESELRPKIYDALVALDDARHQVTQAVDAEATRAALAEAIHRAESLYAYEEQGIPTSLPTPSELLTEYKRRLEELDPASPR